MAKCWDGRYAFERGEEVQVSAGHPLAGHKGIVNTALGDNQFGVLLQRVYTDEGPSIEVPFFGDALCLLPIAQERRDKAQAESEAVVEAQG